MYSLIETAKLNGLNPQLYITDVVARVADHPARTSPRSFPGTGSPPSPTGPPPELAPSPSAYCCSTRPTAAMRVRSRIPSRPSPTIPASAPGRPGTCFLSHKRMPPWLAGSAVPLCARPAATGFMADSRERLTTTAALAPSCPAGDFGDHRRPVRAADVLTLHTRAPAAATPESSGVSQQNPPKAPSLNAGRVYRYQPAIAINPRIHRGPRSKRPSPSRNRCRPCLTTCSPSLRSHTYPTVESPSFR
jgi:hypothetical protein